MLSSFIEQQFHAQDVQYRVSYPTATFEVIQYGGKEVGRVYMEETKRGRRLMKIAILPKYRNFGIGHYLLQQIVDRADKAQNETSLHVERNNPAKKLFERFGYKFNENRGVYDFMIRPIPRQEA